MDKKDALKKAVCEAIDSRSPEIIEIGETIWKNPELGFKEFKTAKLIADKFTKLRLACEKGIGITGVLAKVPGRRQRPNIAVLGEMDSLAIPEHPEADPVTAAVHACGHHAQAAALVGLAFGLVDSDVMKELDGSVTLMAVPSEEPVEIEWRQMLREQGKLFFVGGKQEFIRAGKFDDVDMVLSDHLSSTPGRKVQMSGTKGLGGCGFVGKRIQYIGVEAHAGGAPDKGVNALNAAMLGLMGIHAQRETFREEDVIRVHQILTKGGDITNNIPSDVRMELMVRGMTMDAIKDASMKVNRALRAGAMAVGAEVIITEIPGYMPRLPGSPILTELLRDNMVVLLGAENVTMALPATSTGIVSDIGDVSNIVPNASMSVSGAKGRGHSREYSTVDPEMAYVLPAKGYAMTIIDVLYDGAEASDKILSDFTPTVSKEGYMDYWRTTLSEE